VSVHSALRKKEGGGERKRLLEIMFLTLTNNSCFEVVQPIH